MTFKIEVTFRQGNNRRTRSYKTELSAKRNIYKWLSQQTSNYVKASYFSPEFGHLQFTDAEQLQEFAAKPAANFYASEAWRKLRFEVLKRPAICVVCHRTPTEHGISLHVDHILPRSKHPQLALDINNLQLLCQDCNLGKSDS
ncbi:MAG: HNH endonuclease [Shewanella sp.]